MDTFGHFLGGFHGGSPISSPCHLCVTHKSPLIPGNNLKTLGRPNSSFPKKNATPYSIRGGNFTGPHFLIRWTKWNRAVLRYFPNGSDFRMCPDMTGKMDKHPVPPFEYIVADKGLFGTTLTANPNAITPAKLPLTLYKGTDNITFTNSAESGSSSDSLHQRVGGWCEPVAEASRTRPGAARLMNSTIPRKQGAAGDTVKEF